MRRGAPSGPCAGAWASRNLFRAATECAAVPDQHPQRERGSHAVTAVVIGVDSSTQSTKAAFIDAGTGEQLAVGRAPHVVTGEGGARESDPETWWRALGDAVAAGLKESGLPPAR